MTHLIEAHRHLRAGRPHAAAQILKTLLMFQPQNADGWNGLGLCFQDMGNSAHAERHWREVVERFPDHYDTAHNLGNLLVKSGRVDEAESMFRERLERNPQEWQSFIGLGLSLIEGLRVEDGVAAIKQAAEAAPSPFTLSQAIAYSLHTGYDGALHQKWVEQYVRHLSGVSAAPAMKWDGVRPLRVGLVGTVFKADACANILEPILENTRHECFVFADNFQRDEVSERIAKRVKGWFSTERIPSGDAEQFLAVLQSAEMDVIVDLMGHRDGNRLLSLSRPGAPLTVGYIGYAGATGVYDNIDREVGWAYRPHDNAPDIAPLPFDRNGFITFGSVNRAAKLTKQTMELWTHVLQAVPNSRLLVKVAGGEDNSSARRRLQEAGIPGERLRLLGRTEDKSQMTYLLYANEIDIHLDTVPYNGGTTTFDMLHQGVATVTMSTNDPCQMGARIAENVGLRTFIADHKPLWKENYCWTVQVQAYAIESLREFRKSARSRLPDAKAVARRFDSAIANRVAAITQGGRCCDH